MCFYVWNFFFMRFYLLQFHFFKNNNKKVWGIFWKKLRHYDIVSNERSQRNWKTSQEIDWWRKIYLSKKRQTSFFRKNTFHDLLHLFKMPKNAWMEIQILKNQYKKEGKQYSFMHTYLISISLNQGRESQLKKKKWNL